MTRMFSVATLSSLTVATLLPVCLPPVSAQHSDSAGSPAPPTIRSPEELRAGLEEPQILEPSQGRPMILQRSEQFRLLVRLGPGLEGSTYVHIEHTQAPGVTLQLTAAEPPVVIDVRYGALTLQVPPNAPPGLYDLTVRSSARTLTARRSLKIVESFRTRFRFVHLSDMTIDDPSAPAFDDRLVSEINLLAPEFIIATGDFTAFSRELDDAESWTRVLDFLARFSAPVYVVCGDLDHEGSFATRVAHSPVGTIQYGEYHAVLLMNHARHPIDRDQIAFLKKDLDAHAARTFNILVSHDDNPAFLEQLAPRAELAEYLRSRNVRLLITGGSDDWDRTEYAARLEGLGIAYIRTHQSSTALRGRATGVSHYRVFDVDGDRVSCTYTGGEALDGVDASIPVGFLRLFEEPSPSGTVIVAIQNALKRPFEDARVWLNVPKAGAARPLVAGARAVQVLDAGESWAVEAAVDLPDMGGAKIFASASRIPPPPLPLEAELRGDRTLAFTRERTADGLTYLTSDQDLQIAIRSTSERAIRVHPVVRLSGGIVSWTVDGEAAWNLDLAPGQVRVLALRLRLPQVTAGEHLLQLLYLEDPLRRPVTFPLTLSVN